MGKLRVEPKTRGLGTERYKELAELLTGARRAAGENRVFYDLDKDEKGNSTRLELISVARNEGIAVSIRKLRKQHALELNFASSAARQSNNARISAENFKQRVIETIVAEGRPMQRGEILQKTGLSPSSWHVRILELLKDGRIVKTGHRRQAFYAVP